MLYKIGDFSKKTGLSIRTLRYYDEIDLFKPVEIDLFTNYRYYSEEQLEDLNIINDLKDCGFTLEEIKKYWNNFSNDIMLERKKELLKDIKQTEEKIRKVEYLRNRIEDGKIRHNNKQNKIKYKEKSLLK
ncbi:MAG: MerR family transcriptional regulator [Bacilli bacterium]